MKKMEVEEKEIVLNHHAIEEEVELIDYLRVIWKRRGLILFGTILSMVFAGAVSFALPPRYEATAQVRIGRVWDKEIENPYLTSEMIDSDAFLVRIIEKLHLPTTPYQMKKRKVVEVRVLEGGATGQKLPLLLSIQARATDPQQTVDVANAVAHFLVEEHQKRFEEKLKEYQFYEEELAREAARIEDQIRDLEKMIKKQSLGPTVNAPSVILLQAQLEEKNVQLLNFKRELKDTRVNNTSSIVTENTRLVAAPVLPKDHINPKVGLTMAVVGVLALFVSLMLGFFLEYLEQVRLRESKS